MQGLDDDERRVVREALAHLAEGHEWALSHSGGADRPHSPAQRQTSRDAATARRLIREHFQPGPRG